MPASPEPGRAAGLPGKVDVEELESQLESNEVRPVPAGPGDDTGTNDAAKDDAATDDPVPMLPEPEVAPRAGEELRPVAPITAAPPTASHRQRATTMGIETEFQPLQPRGPAQPISPSVAFNPLIGRPKERSLPIASAMAIIRLVRKKQVRVLVEKPLPEGVDHSIMGIKDAWAWFQKIDADNSGRLDWGEVTELGRRLGLSWSKRRLKRAYDDMTSDPHGASFHDFALWWAQQQAVARRGCRAPVPPRCARMWHLI